VPTRRTGLALVLIAACLLALGGGGWWLAHSSGWLGDREPLPAATTPADATESPSTPADTAASPNEDEPEPEADPLPPPPGAYQVELRGTGRMLHASLHDQAPSPVELVLQSALAPDPARAGEELGWDELAREVLEPGESTVISFEELAGSRFGAAGEMTMAFREGRRDLEWVNPDAVQMPTGIVASVQERRLNLADREKGLLVVIKPKAEDQLDAGPEPGTAPTIAPHAEDGPEPDEAEDGSPADEGAEPADGLPLLPLPRPGRD
jgi:hypothetical protein